jgi:HPt (histidine-containing phosphotransfer) domain-containing protein
MTTSTTPVLDPVPLQRQTMGDSAHRLELLALFVVEAERLMRQIEEATDKQVMLERLQALAGSARNIGALRLMQTARLLESHVGENEPDLEALRTAVAETLAYIRRSA